MRLFPALVVLLVFAAAASAQQALFPGSAAPTFTLAAMDGRTYDLTQLRGKVVLITFWSTRCNICHSERPNMNRLAARYKGQDVVFLALAVENQAKVAAYVKSNPFDFTIVPNSFGAVLQYADRDRSGALNMGFPAYFLIDQNGVLRLKSNGWDKTSSIDAQIARLLNSSRMVASASLR